MSHITKMEPNEPIELQQIKKEQTEHQYISRRDIRSRWKTQLLTINAAIQSATRAEKLWNENKKEISEKEAALDKISSLETALEESNSKIKDLNEINTRLADDLDIAKFLLKTKSEDIALLEKELASLKKTLSKQRNEYNNVSVLII